MRVLSITAGAAGMYCGSCLRDNGLARELLARGHEVTLLPLYTPTVTDEPNVSSREVLFGGISLYLQQMSPLFRRLPRRVRRLLDHPALINRFAGRASSTDPRMLGELTISMLEGANGVLGGEFDRLLEWVRDEPLPDIVNLPNSMLIGLARPLAAALNRPVCCTLQGEELFLNGLDTRYRARALELITRQVPYVDRFLAVSEYEATFMGTLLQIPPARLAVVPLGVDFTGFEPRRAEQVGQAGNPFRVGFLARVAPEKGLLVLAQAYERFRRRAPDAAARLEAAGYLGPAYRPYLNEVVRALEHSGLADEFAYRGVVDRDGKIDFLRSVDVLSVPATYDEPKGMSVIEAMGAGVPVVLPRRGAFTEMLERTGGGLLVAPDDPDALAEGLERLYRDHDLRAQLARRAFDGARTHYSIRRSADRLLQEYGEVLGSGRDHENTAVGSGAAAR